MDKLYPEKLKPGDKVAVIAPSQSLAIIPKENQGIANDRFKELGLELVFGKNVNENGSFSSSSSKSRISDLHEAFSNKEIKAIIAVIGGFNSNQLLRHIDWELIKNNPKIFLGYSDITALQNAIFAKTGLVTYSGPHYSTFGQKLYFDYTLEYFKKCLFSDEPFEIKSSENYTDDQWYLDQENRNPIKNPGPYIINEGEAEGTILGANLCTFNLLQGTKYFPDLTNSILFLEDDAMSIPELFDRDLQSLTHQPEFEKARGLVIGRFQKKSNMTKELLTEIIKTKKELDQLPVIADADFGHTQSLITFPIGGETKISAQERGVKIEIVRH